MTEPDTMDDTTEPNTEDLVMDEAGVDADGLDLHELEVTEEAEPDLTDEQAGAKNAADLEAVFDVPVRVSAVLGQSRMPVSDLLNLTKGNVVELDRKVGEAIDIYVNDRLVARGEVVIVEEKLGVTMTEIIKTDK